MDLDKELIQKAFELLPEKEKQKMLPEIVTRLVTQLTTKDQNIVLTKILGKIVNNQKLKKGI